MTDSDLQINIAAIQRGVTTLGPGLRSAVWVMGCPIGCQGCIAPEWIPIKPAVLISPLDLADQLLSDPLVSGITISGGEPMLQAPALAEMLRLARMHRDINVICFSGYTLDQLSGFPPRFGVNDLLKQIDVLVDGPYIAELNDNQGLRGSRNQVIHYLTGRLAGCDLENTPRQADIRVTNGFMFLVGVPPIQVDMQLAGKLTEDELNTRLKEISNVRS